MHTSIQTTLCSLYKTLSFKDSTPFDLEKDDFYYMGQGKGLEERVYVYLNQNRLFDNTQDLCVISEIGFGTGLSFCATLNLWKKVKKPGQKLVYISIEKEPLCPQSLKSSLQAWRQELDSSITALLSVYQGLSPGVNFLPFLNDDLMCILLIGEAAQMLRSYEFHSQHWMLDGFSPAKNPSAWSPEVLTLITERSAPGCSLASFTAASHVRLTLEGLGWEMERKKGFHHKKHCLFGMLRKTLSEHSQAEIPKNQLFSILGHGIAGSSLSYFFHFFGYKTINFYVPTAPCASEAPWIYTQPRIHQSYDSYTAFNLKSYMFSGHFYRQIAPALIEEGFEVPKDPEKKDTQILETLFSAGCHEFFEITPTSIVYHHAVQAQGGALITHLQNLAETQLQKINLEEIQKADFYAHAWASMYYDPLFSDRTLSKGELFAQEDQTWSMPSHKRCDFSWTKPTSRFFCGFRSQTKTYLPHFGFLPQGEGFSLHHGSKGFSSGPYCALVLVLEKLGLFRVARHTEV